MAVAVREPLEVIEERPATRPVPIGTRGRALPYAWPLYAMLIGYPVFWATGLYAVMWPLLSVPMLSYLIRSRATLKVPRGFMIWALFLCWVVLSGVSLRNSSRALAFAYRGCLYLTATIVLVYMFNIDRSRISARQIAYAFAFLWITVVLFGFLAMTFPTTQWNSPLYYILPGKLVHNPFVFSMVHPSFAGVSTLLGFTTLRPRSPFNYTNEWGSNLAILTPMAVYAVTFMQRRIYKLAMITLLVLSLIPIIYSINRGLWISLTAAVFWVILRLGLRGHVRLLTGSLALVAVGAAVVLFSPLQGVIVARLAHPNTQGRSTLYASATDKAFASPIIGYGAPQPVPGDPTGPSAGTHGQLWTLMVSQGFPGTALYILWFGFALLAAWRLSSAGLWVQAALLAGAVQMPVYNQLPVQLHLMMIAIALMWWDVSGRSVGRDRHARPAANAARQRSPGEPVTSPA